MELAVDRVVEKLCGVPAAQFRPGSVCELLHGMSLDPASLTPYLHFAPRRYTRNLIYRDDLFELIALCWEPHTESPIHNHSGQLCWLSIQRGALRLDNYHSLDGPGPGTGIRLQPIACLDRASAGCVDLQQGEDGIHRVSNPFPERAVSLHVYSRPYDTCLVYDPNGTAREMRLSYHSIGGRLLERPKGEHVQ